VGVFFLEPGIVELAINALDGRIALFLRQHAVAEHQDLGAFDGKVPALIRQSLLQVIEIGACRLGARVASPVTTALARSALARPCIRVKDSSLTRRIRVAGDLFEIGSHAIEHRDDGFGGSEIGVFVDHLECCVLDRTASLTVDLLPMVAEQANDRPRTRT
tara:strand:- start:571 stop:1053 length:483 start_codon:yes stop_codon:yes gene_type:complete